MDPAIWAAAVGGLITAVPAVWAVMASNRVNRRIAVNTQGETRAQAERQMLLARIGAIKIDLRDPDPTVQMDALDELEQLLLAVKHEPDRRWVWNMLNSRMAQKIRQYAEEGPEIKFLPPPEPPEREG